MKYIIFHNNETDVSTPVLFPPHLNHQAMIEGAGFASIVQNRNVDFRVNLELGVPVSAGFITMKHGLLTCYGESETAELKSRPRRDASIINLALSEKH